MPTLTEAIDLQKEAAQSATTTQFKRQGIEDGSTAKINGETVGWQTTLDTLDGTVVEAIKYYLSAGVSQGDLAKAYGVTAQQVAAVKIALEDYATALTATADLEKAEADQRKVITAAMLKPTNDRVLAEFQKKQAAEASEAAFLKANLADAQAQDAIQQGVTTTTAATTGGRHDRDRVHATFQAVARIVRAVPGRRGARAPPR